MQRREQEPGAFTWLLAFVSLLLPWAAALVAMLGVWRLAQGEFAGYWHFAAAGLMLIADAVIDQIWAHPTVRPTDQPDLNRRPEQLIGRVVTVEEAIVHGRGKARIGDTLWEIEGPDMPAGASARVTSARGAVLVVARL